MHDFPTEPQIPDWKTPFHLWENNKVEECRQQKLCEILPSSASRISWLTDPNNQLDSLFTYFQSCGIPMGSPTWATKAKLWMMRLEEERSAAIRLLRQYHDGQQPDFEGFENQLDHIRKLYIKRKPKTLQKCDWCGWEGARLIGGGYAACFDCLPQGDKSP